MEFRLTTSLTLLFAIIFLPFWVYLPILLASIIVFPLYWEGMVFAFLIDILYGLGVPGISGLLSSMSFWALAVLIVLLPVRARIRIHA